MGRQPVFMALGIADRGTDFFVAHDRSRASQRVSLRWVTRCGWAVSSPRRWILLFW